MLNIHPDRVSMIHEQTVSPSDFPLNLTQIRKRKRPSSFAHTYTTVTTVKQCEYHPHATSHSSGDCRTNKRLRAQLSPSKTKSLVKTTKTSGSDTCIPLHMNGVKRKNNKESKHHPSSTTHTTAECRTKGKLRTERSPDITPAPVKGTTVSQQSLSASRQRTSIKIQCYNCGSYGHYSSKCTQPSASASPSTGQRAHIDQSLFASCPTTPISYIS